MRLAFIALAALVVSTPVVSAEIPKAERQALSVGYADLDLSTERGQSRLTLRFLTKMQAICGSLSDVSIISYLPTGIREQRAACKASLALDPKTSEPVQRAFAAALVKFK